MTVEHLDTAKSIVEEDPDGIVAVYAYQSVYHRDKTLYSVEHWTQAGCTLRSSYVSQPKLIYTKEGGWTEGL